MRELNEPEWWVWSWKLKMLIVISGSASQVGCELEETKLWREMDEVIQKIPRVENRGKQKW